MENNTPLILSFIYNSLIACVYILNTYGIGYGICRPFTLSIDNKLTAFVLRWALGWNVIVFFVHILGLLSVLNAVSYLILSFSGLLLLIIFNKNILSGLKKNYLSCRKQIIVILIDNKFVVGLLLFFIFIIYLISLAPVSKTDELNYYFYFVKRIVSQGALLFDYFQVISFQPMVQQLWYVPVYGLGATEAPAVLNVFTSLLIILFSYSWLIKYTNSKLALIAILATYINLNGVGIYPAPQDNVACWLWGLMSLIATYEFLYSDQSYDDLDVRFLLLGVVYVTACLVKLTNLPLIVLCLFAILYKAYVNKINYKQLFLLFIPFAVFYIPFLIRTYLWTGSPFFPALANFFGSTTFNIEAMNVYLQRPALHWPDNIIGIFFYLVRMFKHTILFNLSPLLILLSPIALFYLFYRKKYLIGIIISLYMIIMFFATASYRLMGGCLIFLLLTMFVLNNGLIKKNFMQTLIKLHAIFLVIITVIYFIQFGKYMAGFETKKEFLNMKVQTYQGIEWANHNLPIGSRILTTTREKYYFDFPVYSTVEYPLIMGEDARKIKTSDDLYLFTKRHGITHLFLAEWGKDFYGPSFIKFLNEVARKYGNLIYEEENATIRGVRHPLRKPEVGKLKAYELH